ncbi:MAG: ribosome-associated translation inhibitor RaiA [Gammaproteobacteria bacterium]|nr:ribosome-associated translation inhibitor RaiA [Gammaproteobacteria bacterium]
MQINLTGHHIDLTDSMKAYVNEKVLKLERHFDQVTDTHVILTVDSGGHKAEATVHMSGNNVFADCVADDMYAAIDGLVDKLDRQVKKYKEKLKNHLHHKQPQPQEIIE